MFSTEDANRRATRAGFGAALLAALLAGFAGCTDKREPVTGDPARTDITPDASEVPDASVDDASLDALQDANQEDGTTPRQGCPVDLPGPSMVELPSPDGKTTYCIDKTEVTQGDYFQFLKAKGAAFDPVTGGDMSGQPPECKENQRYLEFISEASECYHKWNSWDPTGGHTNYPVGCIDWCDAFMYCQYAGKRLCGRIGGGAVDLEQPASAATDQWFNACTQGGKTAFPFGDAPQGTTCVTSGYLDAETAATGEFTPPPRLPRTAAECHGQQPPFDQVYDLIGNVAEWVDARTVDPGTGLTVFAFRSPSRTGGTGPEPAPCDYYGGGYAIWTNRSDIGFRCCLD